MKILPSFSSRKCDFDTFFSICFAQTTSAAPSTSAVSTTVGQIPSDSEHHVILGENSPGYTAEGEIISTQTVSSKTRTVETITVSPISFHY